MNAPFSFLFKMKLLLLIYLSQKITTMNELKESNTDENKNLRG